MPLLHVAEIDGRAGFAAPGGPSHTGVLDRVGQLLSCGFPGEAIGVDGEETSRRPGPLAAKAVPLWAEDRTPAIRFRAASEANGPCHVAVPSGFEPPHVVACEGGGRPTICAPAA